MPPELPPGFVLDQPASSGGPAYGPPPVVDPMEAERVRISRQGADLNQAEFDYRRQRDAVEDAAAGTGADAQRQADERAMAQLARMIGKMGQIALDANDNGGWLETGTSGSLARASLPAGTAGRDLASDIDTLRANFAFDALQAMRDASKTGGALGQVTERELQLLESSIANVDPNQSHEQFLRNIQSARQAYLSKLAMINPQLASNMGYNPQEAEAAMLGINEAYNREFGIDSPIEITRNAATNPVETTPADIEEIMRRYGGGQ